MSAAPEARRSRVVSTVRDDADTCEYVIGEPGLAELPAPYAAAWLALQRGHRQLTRQLEAALEQRHGLSLSALEVLGRLAAADARRRRLTGLAADVGLSLSRVSRIVDALERRGLVNREPCPDDARATNARLTDAGLTLAREAQAAHLEDIERSFLDHLSAEHVRMLGDVFGRLVQPPGSQWGR
jgi:DNA-binding MarR family transcriptional regulator